MRLTAAVYETFRPILNEMRASISNTVENKIEDTVSQAFVNFTQQVDTKLSSINESMRDIFSGVKKNLNNTPNVICDKMDNQTTLELMTMEQNLTRELIYNRESIHNTGGLKCGGTWGWRRAVYLDMTDPNTNCPSGWNMTGYSKRTCGRATDGQFTCDSVFYPVIGGPYSQVCGRIRAYQWGVPDGFWGYNHQQNTIDSVYVTGVAVMHGSTPQHIWTFANGRRENYGRHYVGLCPCDTSGHVSIPSFVGEDYFCESGHVLGHSGQIYRLHSEDILWDGRDCHSTSTCCSFHNPPYFTKTLSQTTTDDLELRMCFKYQLQYNNIAVELVEFYVK